MKNFYLKRCLKGQIPTAASRLKHIRVWIFTWMSGLRCFVRWTGPFHDGVRFIQWHAAPVHVSPATSPTLLSFSNWTSAESHSRLLFFPCCVMLWPHLPDHQLLLTERIPTSITVSLNQNDQEKLSPKIYGRLSQPLAKLLLQFSVACIITLWEQRILVYNETFSNSSCRKTEIQIPWENGSLVTEGSQLSIT